MMCIKTYTFMDSPVGRLFLAMDKECLSELKFAGKERNVFIGQGYKQSATPFIEVIRQLKAYFAGDLKEFDLPLKLEGTPFQLAAWKTLRTIPYGKTLSYKEQAIRMGRPRAVRAVGTANGRNPISIIVPCHRVIGSNGQLTGYGGGLEAKTTLLNLEQAQSAIPMLFPR